MTLSLSLTASMPMALQRLPHASAFSHATA